MPFRLDPVFFAGNVKYLTMTLKKSGLSSFFVNYYDVSYKLYKELYS